MSDELMIARDGVSISLNEAYFDNSGWLESYRVTLKAAGLFATTRVENPPYGMDPTQLFTDLAKNWRGWEGEKNWGAMEGELDFAAVSDSTGHTTLTVHVNSGGFPETWSVKTSIILEAGQLEEIQRQFSSFFATQA